MEVDVFYRLMCSAFYSLQANGRTVSYMGLGMDVACGALPLVLASGELGAGTHAVLAASRSLQRGAAQALPALSLFRQLPPPRVFFIIFPQIDSCGSHF